MKDDNQVWEEESSMQHPHTDHKAKMRVVWHRQKEDAGLHWKVPVVSLKRPGPTNAADCSCSTDVCHSGGKSSGSTNSAVAWDHWCIKAGKSLQDWGHIH